MIVNSISVLITGNSFFFPLLYFGQSGRIALEVSGNVRVRYLQNLYNYSCMVHALDFLFHQDSHIPLSYNSLPVLKEHSRLAHMRIRYCFIANLHITETRSILILTRYDKNNIVV